MCTLQKLITYLNIYYFIIFRSLIPCINEITKKMESLGLPLHDRKELCIDLTFR